MRPVEGFAKMHWNFGQSGGLKNSRLLSDFALAYSAGIKF